MNNTNNASTDHHQWLHYYQQTTPAANPPAITSGNGSTRPDFSNTTTSTIVTTSFTTNNSYSKSTSLGNSTNVHLNPQASAGKPIRRRSRAPRRNPTTLLNASTTNFRSLVQQFTGCQSTKATSFGSQKGPLNLSFGMPRNQKVHQISGTSSRIVPLGSEYYYNQQLINPVVHDQRQGQQWQQQQLFEKLQINNNNINNNMQSGGLDDDFAIGDVPDLHELLDW